ncbi:MAG: hypothetical protein DRQ55_16185 [Planctomycetota bacterium]|nr:MAG: hypothetical protein DRQ55_16185 [Planctomycetota bacterium]
MSSALLILLRILALMAAGMVGFYLLIKLVMALGWVAGSVGRGIGAVARRLGNFVGGMLSDTVRLIGGAVTALVFVPLVLTNVAVGRWSRANHYGRALEREGVGVATAAWRLALGHPARLLGLEHLIEGVERRIPEAMARAPGPDTPGNGDPNAFEGYRITGALPSGGSGARLFLAEPTLDKRRQLSGTGLSVPDRVVIKSFSLHDGSTMPQIVRESRALEAARDLGLVLEHALAGTRFHYVMPFVPGEDLGVVTQRLHAGSGAEGLGDRELGQVMAHTADLLSILHRFHAKGLWHKDVKPNNIIVSEGRVQLVDLGLTTPLASAMTLTTHGTEYFRDPELVRLAMRGVKVHEVDGVKFDVYGAGAVLFSMVENSFPAHGSLSLITRRCPEALRWIVRRSMADLGSRYANTAEMLADLRTVMSARNPHKVKPGQLPSMAGRPELVARIESELNAAHGTPAAAPRLRAATSASPRPRHERNVASSKRRGGVAAAVIGVGLLLILGMGAAFLLLTPSSASIESWSTATPTPMSYAVLPASRTRSEPRAAIDWSSHRPEPATILLVDEIPDAASDTARAWVATALDRIEQARFSLVGSGRAHALGEEREIALHAEALKTIGLSDPTNPDTLQRLQAFVAQHGDELSGLLWFGRAGDSPDNLAWRYVGEREIDSQDMRAIFSQGILSQGQANREPRPDGAAY